MCICLFIRRRDKPAAIPATRIMLYRYVINSEVLIRFLWSLEVY